MDFTSKHLKDLEGFDNSIRVTRPVSKKKHTHFRTKTFWDSIRNTYWIFDKEKNRHVKNTILLKPGPECFFSKELELILANGKTIELSRRNILTAYVLFTDPKACPKDLDVYLNPGEAVPAASIQFDNCDPAGLRELVYGNATTHSRIMRRESWKKYYKPSKFDSWTPYLPIRASHNFSMLPNTRSSVSTTGYQPEYVPSNTNIPMYTHTRHDGVVKTPGGLLQEPAANHHLYRPLNEIIAFVMIGICLANLAFMICQVYKYFRKRAARKKQDARDFGEPETYSQFLKNSKNEGGNEKF
eukprot:GHVQ01039293.1.p1 GENE.GHVQ01039293.1~~GHVQ01039293.1.p1  ORF type:complete len:299 (-),score=11.05 GHVQ01039293.1:450-1346(-)